MVAGMNSRLFFIIIVAFAFGGLAALALFGNNGQRAGSGKVLVGGPFSLTNHEGKRVTDEDFRGKYLLIMFGYTYCPDICPGELQTITNAMEELGPAADAIVPAFVTVDPQRDTVAKVAEYVKNFSPRVVGLTGTEEEIKAAAKAYRVYFAKEPSSTPSPGNEYLISHSTFIYLMSPAGEYVTHFVYGVTPEQMVAKLRKYVGG